jgi:hypothetical protein
VYKLPKYCQTLHPPPIPVLPADFSIRTGSIDFNSAFGNFFWGVVDKLNNSGRI